MVGIQGVTQSEDETETENGEIGRISHAGSRTIRRRRLGRTYAARECETRSRWRWFAVIRRARASRDADPRASDRCRSVRLHADPHAPGLSGLLRPGHGALPNQTE